MGANIMHCVVFDGVGQESLQDRATVAVHAVGSGISVGDNSQPEPKRYDCEVWISSRLDIDEPDRQPPQPYPGVRLLVAPSQAGRFVDRRAQVRHYLDILKGQLVDVYTAKHGLLEEYALESYRVTSNTSNKMSVSLSFVEIRVATADTVKIPIVPRAAKQWVESRRGGVKPDNYELKNKSILCTIACEEQIGPRNATSLVWEGDSGGVAYDFDEAFSWRDTLDNESGNRVTNDPTNFVELVE